MIDTIKISVYKEFNSTIYETLLYNSENRSHGFRTNSATGITEKVDVFRAVSNIYDTYDMLLIKGKINVPSWNYDINYRCFDDRIDLEFSLPKFVYGTNCFELRNHSNISSDQSPYDMLVLALKKFFDYYFCGHVVDWGGIALLRWDICFNQLYSSKNEALKALEIIKLKHSRQKDTRNYKTGFIALTSSKFFKIYHKGAEFDKHDKRKLKINTDYLQDFSDCILRYERKITPKNIAYWYNVHVKYGTHTQVVKEYRKAKNKGIATREQRSNFENVQKFTLGKSKLLNHTLMDRFVFDHLYTLFRDDIRKKFDLSKRSISFLDDAVIIKQNPLLITIYEKIKSHGSLRKAFERGVLPKSTYYKYEKVLRNENISNTKRNVTIPQCWNHTAYFQHIRRNFLNVQSFSKDIRF